jgi:hypothetical protein
MSSVAAPKIAEDSEKHKPFHFHNLNPNKNEEVDYNELVSTWRKDQGVKATEVISANSNLANSTKEEDKVLNCMQEFGQFCRKLWMKA